MNADTVMSNNVHFDRTNWFAGGYKYGAICATVFAAHQSSIDWCAGQRPLVLSASTQ